MIDYVGRGGTGIQGDMQAWGQMYGQQDERRQNRYLAGEARRRYDEAQRYRLDDARSLAEFQARNADQFQNTGSELAGLRPQDSMDTAPKTDNYSSGGGISTYAAGGNPNSTASTGGAQTIPATPQSTDPVIWRWRQQGGVVTPQMLQQDHTLEARMRAAIRRREISVSARGDGSFAVGPYTRTPGHLDELLTPLYNASNAMSTGGQAGAIGRANGRVIAGAVQGAGRWLFGDNSNNDPIPQNKAATPPTYGMVSSPVPGTTSGQAAPAAGLTEQAPTNTPSPAASVVPPIPGSVPGPAAAAGGLTPPDTTISQQGDTSRPVAPTAEMRLINTHIQGSLRRAQVAAAHGDTATSETAYAEALQGQAAYLQQANMQLYRLAAGGSLTAMSTLLAHFQGQNPDNMQLVPTDKTRRNFNLQVRNASGAWVNGTAAPRSRDEILSGLLNLVDAQGAAARTEANTEMYRVAQQTGAQMYVADREQQTAIYRSLTDVQIHQMDNRAAQALANGRAHVTVDSNTGGVWVDYSGVDAHGNVVPYTDYVHLENVPTASTSGNRTTQVPVSQRVTGTAGVTAGGR